MYKVYFKALVKGSKGKIVCEAFKLYRRISVHRNIL